MGIARGSPHLVSRSTLLRMQDDTKEQEQGTIVDYRAGAPQPAAPSAPPKKETLYERPEVMVNGELQPSNPAQFKTGISSNMRAKLLKENQVLGGDPNKKSSNPI